MEMNYTPLDTSRLEALHLEKTGSSKTHHSKLPNVFLMLSVFVFVAGIGFAVRHSQTSTNTQANYVPAKDVPTQSEQITSNIPVKDDTAFLEYEMKHLDQTVTSADIQTRFTLMQEKGSEATLTADMKTIIGRTLMREAITKIEVESRTGYIIGMWLPPEIDLSKLPAEQKQKVLVQREDKTKFLSDLANELEQGSTLAKIMPELYEKYPNLQSVISVNGLRLTTANMGPATSIPQIYEEKKYNAENPLYKKLFSMSKGETELYTEDLRTGSGGYIIQVLDSANSQNKSYEDVINTRIP